MRRLLAPLVLAGLLAGCVDSGSGAEDLTPVDPGSVPETAAAVDGPAIRGSVRDTAGTPVPGARVTVTLLRSKQERTSVGIGAAFSLGLSCLADKRGCKSPTAQGVSAGDGSYAIKMPANNGEPPVGVAISVVAPVGNSADERVGTTVTLPAQATAGATFDVPVASEGLKLTLNKEANVPGHDLRVAMPATRQAKPTGPVSVTLTQLPADGDVSGATADFTETPVKLPFDLRVAEDSRLLVAAHREAQIGDRPVTLSATSVLKGTAVPASRGAACRVTDSQGKALAQQPCGLTDGLLGSPWTPTDDPACADGPCPGTAQNDHRDIYVTLADPVRATLLVVRGCGFTCTVMVSADGKTFRELPAPDNAAGTDGFYVQKLSGAPVKVVHIRTATGGFFVKLREASVFL
ncbi:MAG TPA: carboxypeptidase-like regulatory domain-containing protein [Sporichthya sp.]|nr:carboxypeptidase-like regulatory domain-containing protein [Sporichthya sp.]